MSSKACEILPLALVLLLSACGTPAPMPTSHPEGRIKVMVSIVPQGYFVERIGGTRSTYL